MQATKDKRFINRECRHCQSINDIAQTNFHSLVLRYETRAPFLSSNVINNLYHRFFHKQIYLHVRRAIFTFKIIFFVCVCEMYDFLIEFFFMTMSA